MYDKTNKNQRLWVTTDPYIAYDDEAEMLDSYNEFAFGNDYEEKNEFDEEVYDFVAANVSDVWNEKFDVGLARNVKNVVIKGYVGLWDGKHKIVPERCEDLKEAIDKCCNIRGDWNAIIYFEKDEEGDEHLYVEVPHHDGTNLFEIQKVTAEDDDYYAYTTKPLSWEDVMNV